MLDIQFIRENAEAVQNACFLKKIDLKIDELIRVDAARKVLQQKIETLQARKNELAASGKSGKPSAEVIEEGKKIKEEISELEKQFQKIDETFFDLMAQVPTIPSKDTPIGKDDSENVEVYKWGEPRKFDFTLKSHIELAENLDLIDFDRGAKVAGYRGYYLKNDAVMLQMGLMMFTLQKLISKGFIPIIPPTLVRAFPLFGSGYFRGSQYDAETDEIYKIANDEKLADGTLKKEDRFLIGTAEPSLLAYYANEVLNESELPIKMCGFSPCYRSEIGSYGKDTKGLYRVHEFMKVEMVAIMPADVDLSHQIHEEFIGISRELHEELGLPYRQIAICTGDLGAGKYKQYDMEAWMPSRNGYGETGSASNFLDWQSRRLNVRYKTKNSEKKFVYMLNNTALPSPRPLIALLENHQTKEGGIQVPKVLQQYVGKSLIDKADKAK